MKKALLMSAIALAAIFTSCSKSNEDIARETIEAYLKENLNDPSTYEFVKMDSISDVWIRTVDETFEYESLQHKLQINKDGLPEFEAISKAAGEKQRAEIASIEKEIAQVVRDFKPRHIGKFVQLKFRCKNAIGAKVIHNCRFKLSDDLKTVESVEQIEE